MIETTRCRAGRLRMQASPRGCSAQRSGALGRPASSEGTSLDRPATKQKRDQAFTAFNHCGAGLSPAAEVRNLRKVPRPPRRTAVVIALCYTTIMICRSHNFRPTHPSTSGSYQIGRDLLRQFAIISFSDRKITLLSQRFSSPTRSTHREKKEELSTSFSNPSKSSRTVLEHCFTKAAVRVSRPRSSPGRASSSAHLTPRRLCK
jgi:hypothetical protein